MVRWRYLLNLLVRTGVTTRYRNSALGWTWSYVRPAAQFLVFWVVLGLFMNLDRGIPNYAVYLFSGIVIINLFSEAFKNATTSIVGNAALVRKVFLPRQLFGVSSVVVAFVHFLPQVGLLLIVSILLGWILHISVLSVLAIFAAMVIVMIFALGLGLFFGAINVRYRDADNFGELIRQVVLWLSPVLYPWRLISEALGDVWVYLYFCNPISVAVELMHFGFWSPTVPTFHATDEVGGWFGFPPAFGWYIGGALVLSLLLLLLGQYTFRRFERTFAQDV